MTALHSDRAALRAALEVLTEEAPPPPDWKSWEASPVRHLDRDAARWGPVVAATAAISVLVVVGGLVALVNRERAGSNPASGNATPTTAVTAAPPLAESGRWDTWGDLHAAVLATSQLLADDPLIRVAAPGPLPDFDTSALGFPQPIEWDAAIGRNVDWNELVDMPGLRDVGPITVAGRVEGSLVALFEATYAFGGAPPAHGTCVMTISGADQESLESALSCGPATKPIEYGFSGGVFASEHGGDDAVLFVVPPETSVVALSSPAAQLWQRPRGGFAFFVAPLNGNANFVAYSATGEIILEGTLDGDVPEDE